MPLIEASNSAILRLSQPHTTVDAMWPKQAYPKLSPLSLLCNQTCLQQCWCVQYTWDNGHAAAGRLSQRGCLKSRRRKWDLCPEPMPPEAGTCNAGIAMGVLVTNFDCTGCRELEAMLQELQRLQPGGSCLGTCPELPLGATPIVIASRPGLSLETPRVCSIHQPRHAPRQACTYRLSKVVKLKPLCFPGSVMESWISHLQTLLVSKA